MIQGFSAFLDAARCAFIVQSSRFARTGVLIERTGYGRNRVWQHSGIIAVLDAYDAGIRRRAQRRG